MLRNALRPLIAAVLLSLIRSASAIELGEIIDASRVNGALRVEIELASADDAWPQQSSCFSLAPDPENLDNLPVVSNGRATLRTLDGRHSVVVNSNQRIGEAAVLSLRLNCGFNVRRDYFLHLAPEEATPAEVLAAEVPVPETSQAPPADRLPPRKPKPVRPRPRASGDRVEVSLTAADEALSRSLATPAPAPAPAVRQAPAAGPATYAAAGAEAVQLDARLSELEATVASLRAELEAATRAHELALAAAAESASRSSPAPAVVSADTALAVVPRNLAPDTSDDTAYSANWLLGIAVGGALLALAALAPASGWLRRRAGGEPDTVVQHPVVAVPRPTPSAGLPADVDVDAHTASGAHAIEVVEPNSPLERAEFMLSFGRVDDAAVALEEYIASNPRDAIEPWLKLLEIYRHAGRRHAFEALARRMHKTFNVTAPLWDRKSIA